jgi:dephospho-CoA kinase
MIIAGLTGTIGTGKSTVAAMFAELGAFIIDADKLAHQVVEPGQKAYQGIVDYFGKEESMTTARSTARSWPTSSSKTRTSCSS